MRAVVQRVSAAEVRVAERSVGRIGPGLVVLLGVAAGDSTADAEWMADKIVGLRIFENDAGKLDLSLCATGGALLVVSQFTLIADTRRGRRPSFSAAAPPDAAIPLYEHFLQAAAGHGVPVARGEFGAAMDVHLTNHGPLTILLDSDERTQPRR